MFSKTLKAVALATLILGSTSSQAVTVLGFNLGNISLATAKSQYDLAATKINAALPKSDDIIKASVIQEGSANSRSSGKFVRDAVVASIFANLFITKNGSGYKAAAAGLASVICASYSANQLSKTDGSKIKGLGALMVGQNFVQIWNIIYRMLSEGLLKPILEIGGEHDDRTKLSFLVRTLYPLVTLCMLTDSAVSTSPSTAPSPAPSPAPTEESIVLKGMISLDRVLNDFVPSKYFEAPATA